MRGHGVVGLILALALCDSCSHDAASPSSTDHDGGTDAATCDPSQVTCACVAGQCPSGMLCVRGLCVTAGCDYTYQCGAQRVCDDGACVPACDAASPCPAGYFCSNGACSIDSHNPQCSTTTACPAGQVCGPDGLCTAPCTANSQCAAGALCNGTTGTCVPNPSPIPACGAATPCAPPEVCEADGFCHYPCTSLAQCLPFDNRFVACDQGICKTEPETNPQCTRTMPCPNGKTCISNTCF